MFDRKLSREELKVVRTDLISQLDHYQGCSKEYDTIMRHIETLSNLIDETRRKMLDINTVAVILGNIGIAGLVVWYEREHVVTTKIFPFLGKPKN